MHSKIKTSSLKPHLQEKLSNIVWSLSSLCAELLYPVSSDFSVKFSWIHMIWYVYLKYKVCFEQCITFHIMKYACLLAKKRRKTIALFWSTQLKNTPILSRLPCIEGFHQFIDQRSVKLNIMYEQKFVSKCAIGK